MKKILILILVSMFSVLLFACGGRDEPDPVKPDEITRVQDGNGKVFLENGVLVDANIDYTSAELSNALTEHEWYFDYGFYYDNTHVSPKQDEIGSFCPTYIHVDGTMEYSHYPIDDGKIRVISVKGKELASTSQLPAHSSLYIPVDTYIIVALDINSEGEGRIIMDKKLMAISVEGYDSNSSYLRMVWKTIPKNQ